MSNKDSFSRKYPRTKQLNATVNFSSSSDSSSSSSSSSSGFSTSSSGLLLPNNSAPKSSIFNQRPPSIVDQVVNDENTLILIELWSSFLADQFDKLNVTYTVATIKSAINKIKNIKPDVIMEAVMDKVKNKPFKNYSAIKQIRTRTRPFLNDSSSSIDKTNEIEKENNSQTKEIDD